MSLDCENFKNPMEDFGSSWFYKNRENGDEVAWTSLRRT